MAKTHHFGRRRSHPAADLLAGTIPAVIAEVVKRAKLVQPQLQAPGTKVENVSGTAVLRAAETMQSQIAAGGAIQTEGQRANPSMRGDGSRPVSCIERHQGEGWAQ
ncbi:hypothetical protein M8494_14795 [Serratia ureilytica]